MCRKIRSFFWLLALASVVGAWTSQTAAQAQQVIDICEAIDTSGSINDSQLALEIEGFKAALNQVLLLAADAGSTIRLAIVGFSSNVQTFLALTLVNSANRATIEAALDAVQNTTDRRSTNLGGAINQCISLLSASTVPRRVIDLSTDGRPTTGPSTTTAATNAKNAGIELWTLGISPSADNTLLSQIAGCPPASPNCGAKNFPVATFNDFAQAVREKLQLITNGGNQITLSVSKAGTGSGTVTSNPTGINCGPTCSASFAGGTVITLTAVPAAGSTFTGWSGDPDCSDGSVTLNASTNCTATFNTSGVGGPFTLSVSKAGTGSGTVTSNPTGINCGPTCSASFAGGTVITLTAVPAAGSTFTGWSGDPDCSDGSVTLNASTNCTATFNTSGAGGPFTLSVSKTGSGTVTSSPAGINCGSDCSESFANGTVVTLTAAPASGYTFAGWSGDCSNASTSATITMNANKSCTAAFRLSGVAPGIPDLSPIGSVLLIALLALLLLREIYKRAAHSRTGS